MFDFTNLDEYAKVHNSYSIVKCPCCKNDTLDNYWICEHCMWEYDGILDENKYSSANGSNIKDYRNTNSVKY